VEAIVAAAVQAVAVDITAMLQRAVIDHKPKFIENTPTVFFRQSSLLQW
jgi:hypothetical protein